jgi:hypothetical protein
LRSIYIRVHLAKNVQITQYISIACRFLFQRRT